jgi:hypothetical protein
VVPPNADLRWCDGKLNLSSNYTIPARNHVGRDEAIDQFNDLFRQSIRLRLPCGTPFVMPLSGGRDSRHILLELLEQRARPEYCLTAKHIPPRANEDARIAALLAHRLNLTHKVLDPSQSRLLSEIKKNELTQFNAIEHAWTIPIWQFCMNGVRFLYDGIGGDVLTGSAGAIRLDEKNLGLFQDGCFEDVAMKTCASTNEVVLKKFLQPKWYSRFGLETAIARICTELRQHAAAPNPIGSFHFWNRMRRGIGAYSFGVLQDVPLVYCPYLDNDVYDHLASLPASMLMDGKFHTDAICRAYPKYADVPFEDKSAPPQDSRRYYRRYAIELVRHFASRYGSDIVNTSFLVPRMLRWSLSRQPPRLRWMEPEYAIYLLQLEKLCDNVA